MYYSIKGSVLNEKSIPATGVMNSNCLVKIMSLEDINKYLDKYKDTSTHLLKYSGGV